VIENGVQIAVRGHTQKVTARPSRRRGAQTTGGFDPARRAEAIVVFACATARDATQALLFGGYRAYRVGWDAELPSLSCVSEGLFYPDGLEQRDPDAFAQLAAYARRQPPAVELDQLDAVSRMQLLSRSEFVESVLLATLSADGTVVCFGAPFQLSRLATRFGAARGPLYGGGFSFPLLTYRDEDGVVRENLFRPRVRWRPFDARRARIGLSYPRPGSDPDSANRREGMFLDLRTLAYSLTGNDQTPNSAREAFKEQ
jgi:hypothetical protein